MCVWRGGGDTISAVFCCVRIKSELGWNAPPFGGIGGWSLSVLSLAASLTLYVDQMCHQSPRSPCSRGDAPTADARARRATATRDGTVYRVPMVKVGTCDFRVRLCGLALRRGACFSHERLFHRVSSTCFLFIISYATSEQQHRTTGVHTTIIKYTVTATRSSPDVVRVSPTRVWSCSLRSEHPLQMRNHLGHVDRHVATRAKVAVSAMGDAIEING